MPRIQRGSWAVDVFCETAAEFFELLHPTTGLFRSRDHIFRGMPSLSFGLVPSAHRVGARLLSPNSVPLEGPMGSKLLQCGAEFYAIERFFRIVARNGVRVPEDSYILREELDEWRVLFQQSDAAALATKVWPSPQLVSLIALAQHHGVPTRALDWTRSAYVAAYFAARPVLAKPAGDDSFVVWVLDDAVRQIDRVLDPAASRPFRVFTVSGADNANLRAQQGLFMLHDEALTNPRAPFVALDYANLHRESLQILKGASEFVRICVRHTEARQVLSLLSRFGITVGSLHPGLSGAAREYKEEQLLGLDNFYIPPRLDLIGIGDEIQRLSTQTGA